jgi:hypothetical protein
MFECAEDAADTRGYCVHLAAHNGTHMRCQFQLAHPSDGINGGGIGQCQLPNGQLLTQPFQALKAARP